MVNALLFMVLALCFCKESLKGKINTKIFTLNEVFVMQIETNSRD